MTLCYQNARTLENKTTNENVIALFVFFRSLWRFTTYMLKRSSHKVSSRNKNHKYECYCPVLSFCGSLRCFTIAGDADSSRAPGLTSGLQGSVNVHRGALLLVPQWQCISSFVFYIGFHNSLVQNHNQFYCPVCSICRSLWCFTTKMPELWIQKQKYIHVITPFVLLLDHCNTTLPKCQNSGVMNHNCDCYCPVGFTGSLCETVVTDSGNTFTARQKVQYA